MGEVLVATDADWVFNEVDAALGTVGRVVVRAGSGPATLAHVAAASRAGDPPPELVVLDLQIGNMGGMATCLALRHEEGAGRLPRVPIIMLLDRDADVFLARRSNADGWLVKPLDSFRLRKAATAVVAGGRYEEGVPASAPAPLPT